MTWPRAAVYIGIWSLLTAYYVVFERASEPAPPASVPRHGALLDFPGSEVVGVQVESGSQRVRARNAGERWQVVEPAGTAAPADLVAALVTALTEPTDIEIVSDGADAREFGMHGRDRRVTIERRDGSRTTIVLGVRNPAQTAIYAQREGAPEVVLLGLNVQYYFDLLIDAAGNRQAVDRR